MRRFTPTLALAFLALALCLFWLPASHAQAAARLDTTGVLTVAVQNITHDNAPVASQTITLQALQGGTTQDAATATTNDSGRATFTGLDASGNTTYAIYTRFQGGLFFGSAISFDTGAAQQTTLTVADATTSDAALRITSANILINQVNKAKGLISVGEFLTFANTSNTAYVGNLAPANGKPMNLLRFSLPPDATNLTLGAGFAQTQAAQVDTGFGANATVPPGASNFAFAFDVPYTGTSYTFTYNAEYPTDKVLVLSSPGMNATSTSLAPQPPINASGQSFAVLSGGTQPSGNTVTFALNHLPLAGQDPDFDFRLLLIVGAILTLLLLIALGLYVRRGALVVALRPSPRTSRSRAHLPTSDQTRTAEHKQLLQALLDLDTARASGSLSENKYRARQSELRASLRALLAADTDSPDLRENTKAHTPSRDADHPTAPPATDSLADSAESATPATATIQYRGENGEFSPPNSGHNPPFLPSHTATSAESATGVAVSTNEKSAKSATVSATTSAISATTTSKTSRTRSPRGGAR